MYATAHRVVSPRGETGINAFLHKHGTAFPWPTEPWRLPESDPGVLVWDNGPEVPAGGNHVRSYLDVLAPDDVGVEELDAALTGLWLELVADEVGPRAIQGPLPNPVVYRRGNVVLRFGVELQLEGGRAWEMAELRRSIDPATAHWLGIPTHG